MRPVYFSLCIALLLCGGAAYSNDDSVTTTTRRTVVQSSSTTNSDSAATTNGSDATTSNKSSSSSEVIEQSGVMGFRNSNKFVPKYKERIETYKGQIELGTKNGWLSAENAEKFKAELARLTELEAAVAAKNYVKPDIDDLDKQFTKFNMEFSNAGQAKSPPAVPVSTAKPTPVPAFETTSTAPAKPAATATKATTKAPATKAAPASKKAPPSNKAKK